MGGRWLRLIYAPNLLVFADFILNLPQDDIFFLRLKMGEILPCGTI